VSAAPADGAASRRRSIRVGGVRIDLEVRPGVARLTPENRLARAIAAALEAAGAPVPASIGLILADDAELAQLNEAHLGGRGPTDVLSFPLLPPDAFPDHPGKSGAPGTTGARSTAGEGLPRFALPPGRRVHLGDIVVSVERAVAQAAEGRGGQTGDTRWSPADELRLLVSHGVLHVCGWDHAEPVEEAAMQALERELLRPGS
jgi:probable rRNA maturation factor